MKDDIASLEKTKKDQKNKKDLGKKPPVEDEKIEKDDNSEDDKNPEVEEAEDDAKGRPVVATTKSKELSFKKDEKDINKKPEG